MCVGGQVSTCHSAICLLNIHTAPTAFKKVTGKDPLLKKLHSMAFGKPGKAAETKVRLCCLSVCRRWRRWRRWRGWEEKRLD